MINNKKYESELNNINAIKLFNSGVTIVNLLKKYEVNKEDFKNFIIAEKFTTSEILDSEYMENKILILKTRLEDNKIYNQLPWYLENDKIPEVAKYVMRNKLSLSDIVWDITQTSYFKSEHELLDLQEKMLEVADHILGYYQENNSNVSFYI